MAVRKRTLYSTPVHLDVVKKRPKLTAKRTDPAEEGSGDGAAPGSMGSKTSAGPTNSSKSAASAFTPPSLPSNTAEAVVVKRKGEGGACPSGGYTLESAPGGPDDANTDDDDDNDDDDDDGGGGERCGVKVRQSKRYILVLLVEAVPPGGRLALSLSSSSSLGPSLGQSLVLSLGPEDGEEAVRGVVTTPGGSCDPRGL